MAVQQICIDGHVLRVGERGRVWRDWRRSILGECWGGREDSGIPSEGGSTKGEVDGRAGRRAWGFKRRLEEGRFKRRERELNGREGAGRK